MSLEAHTVRPFDCVSLLVVHFRDNFCFAFAMKGNFRQEDCLLHGLAVKLQ